MDLIKEREKRTIRRKIAKSKFDSMITLSADADQGIRLLDEGTVVTAEGNVWFYIEKGALDRYLTNLDDDFEGYIKYGHTEFANAPILLGSFKKSDFSLVDIGDGRKSLYVRPTFFDTYTLRDIQKMPFDVGVSVEMNCFRNDEASEKLGFDVYSDLFISGFAVVGDAGNVNSSGIRLGGSKLDLKEITQALEAQSEIDLSALKDALKDVPATEEKVETEVETEEVEMEVETTEEQEEQVEASVEEEETEEETSMDDVLAQITELTAKVDALEKENADLKGQIETLSAEKNDVSEQLSAKQGEINDFLKAFSGLKLNVSDPQEEKPETKKMSIAMDGIGE